MTTGERKIGIKSEVSHTSLLNRIKFDTTRTLFVSILKRWRSNWITSPRPAEKISNGMWFWDNKSVNSLTLSLNCSGITKANGAENIINKMTIIINDRAIVIIIVVRIDKIKASLLWKSADIKKQFIVTINGTGTSYQTCAYMYK